MAPRYHKPKADIKPSDRGWGPPNARTLPSRVKCNRCKRLKSKDEFSSRQQQLIIDIASANGGLDVATREGFGSCFKCIGGQTHEMTCKICAKVKSKDEFAKAQRRTPDDAKCQMCMEKCLNLAAQDDDDGAADSNSSSEDDYDDDLVTESQTDGGVSLGYNPTTTGDSSTTKHSWYGAPRAGTATTISLATSDQAESRSVAGSQSTGMISKAQDKSSRWARVRSNAVDEMKQLEALQSDEEEDTSKKGRAADNDDDDDDFEL